MARTQVEDCFNWGYDPWHYTVPEGSYASDARDGRVRIMEFRQMVQALHRAGLRVGMDVVYNHTTASGSHPKSVLDRLVPGYYHRLNAQGEVERSTCCDNTATEHLMMGKLMIDSTVVWARDYGIDSFRFDLMGHQPRAVMEQLQRAVNAATGRHIHLLGEGWNFGEVENSQRFVQATQGALNGTGIGSFNDRSRDTLRGGGCCDAATEAPKHQGWVSGLHYDRNETAQALPSSSRREDLLQAADLVRVVLGGSLRDLRVPTWRGSTLPASEVAYGRQGAGFASQPAEVVNYAENHDNETLFDALVLKLPLNTSREDRARAQHLASAVVALSQGVAYFHAGQDILRSKSMDRNSYDSGDWFNRLDWTYTDNGFGAGLPPEAENGKAWGLLANRLTDPRIKPRPTDIAWTRDAFLDLLKIRASTTLLRMRSAEDVQKRLRFFNTGPEQEPTVVAIDIDGQGLRGARYKRLVALINVDVQAHQVSDTSLRGRPLTLHPVQASARAADPRARQASFVSRSGTFSVPARTAVVFVER
jgi:pullulanase-type alpha-1,6-glucosidase